MAEDRYDPSIYAAMQTNSPLATYRKTVLGKVYVSVLSPFDGKVEGVILYGDPNTSELAYIDVWTEKEDVFFKRSNKKHIDAGLIIRTKREEHVPIRKIEQYEDDELREVLHLKFVAFQKLLSETSSLAVAYRLLELAKELEKGPNWIKTIESKVSELQAVTKPIE